MNPQAIRDKVAIVGMGCCKFGENWDKDPQDKIDEAAYEANADAKIEDPQKQIEAVFCGAQYPSKGTAEVADALKLFNRPVSMVVNYCATGTDAFRYGVFAVACGMYDTVLVVGFDKPKDRGVSGPSVAVTGVRMIYENYKQLQGKAEKRQVKNATVALSHNIGGAPQACGICVVAMP